MDRETERPRGFAFITLATQEEVDLAIGQLNDSMCVHLLFSLSLSLL